MTGYNLTLVGSSGQSRARQYSPSRSPKSSIFIANKTALSLAMVATDHSKWPNLDVFT